MSRPVDGWPHLGATLARLVEGKAPAWVSPETQRAAAVLLASLRDDLWAVLTKHAAAPAPEGSRGRGRYTGQIASAEELGVHRDTLATWVREGWVLATKAGK